MLVSRNVPQWWFYNSKSSCIRQFQKSSATCSDCLIWNLLALFQIAVFAKTGWPWIDGLRFLHPFTHFNYPSVQASNDGRFNTINYRSHAGATKKKPRKQNTSSHFWYCKNTTSQKATVAVDIMNQFFIFPENKSIEVLGLRTEGIVKAHPDLQRYFECLNLPTPCGAMILSITQPHVRNHDGHT